MVGWMVECMVGWMVQWMVQWMVWWMVDWMECFNQDYQNQLVLNEISSLRVGSKIRYIFTGIGPDKE